ncbi:MAG: flagellar assembly peptidoglycan hydrolase FlgJ [Methylosarcina sp.]
MLSVNNADAYTNFEGLAKLKSEARKESPEALKEAAKQFESIFLNNVLKSMRETKLAEGILDNDQSKFYSEMYDQQLALHLSGSVGLADLVVRQMKHEDKEPDNNRKLDLEDYLNRSSTASKPVTGQQATVENQAGSKADLKRRESDSDSREFENQMESASAAQRNSGYAGIDARRAINLADFNEELEDFSQTAEFQLKNTQAVSIHSSQDFIKQLHPFAERAAKELGVEPKMLLAQAALETNWGRSLIKHSDGSSFNLFNIKADKSWLGRKAQANAVEFDHGMAKKVNSPFRSYNSFEESFRDYVNFIKNNPRYGDALRQVGNPELYMHKLQQAGYATDPNYAEKVLKIYHSNAMNEVQPDIVIGMNN